jgi:phosphoesterase RecJ-like protein
LERIGRVKELIGDGKLIVNIDHHVSNEKFGKINWVEPEVSSCGEMLYKLFKEMDVALDQAVATNLYVAILTDTGSFRYSNTTSQTHKIASELLEHGLDVMAIHQDIYERRSLDELKLLGLALSTMAVEADGKIVHTAITREMTKDHALALKGTEDFVNHLRSLHGVEVAVFFREEKSDVIQVSFRSKTRINVNRIAAQFGGGGHLRASGCIVKGKMDEMREKIMAEVRKEVAANSQNETNTT